MSTHPSEFRVAIDSVKTMAFVPEEPCKVDDLPVATAGRVYEWKSYAKPDNTYDLGQCISVDRENMEVWRNNNRFVVQALKRMLSGQEFSTIVSTPKPPTSYVKTLQQFVRGKMWDNNFRIVAAIAYLKGVAKFSTEGGVGLADVCTAADDCAALTALEAKKRTVSASSPEDLGLDHAAGCNCNGNKWDGTGTHCQSGMFRVEWVVSDSATAKHHFLDPQIVLSVKCVAGNPQKPDPTTVVPPRAARAAAAAQAPPASAPAPAPAAVAAAAPRAKTREEIRAERLAAMQTAPRRAPGPSGR